jgi:hypothetical protein
MILSQIVYKINAATSALEFVILFYQQHHDVISSRYHDGSDDDAAEELQKVCDEENFKDIFRAQAEDFDGKSSEQHGDDLKSYPKPTVFLDISGVVFSIKISHALVLVVDGEDEEDDVDCNDEFRDEFQHVYERDKIVENCVRIDLDDVNDGGEDCCAGRENHVDL